MEAVNILTMQEHARNEQKIYSICCNAVINKKLEYYKSKTWLDSGLKCSR